MRALLVAVLAWLFVDWDSYVVWVLCWGRGGAPAPERGLTHGCGEVEYDRRLAVVVPLIAAQAERLQESMALWAGDEGVPCVDGGVDADLVFYFDRDLEEEGVGAAVRGLGEFVGGGDVGDVVGRCFRRVRFSSARLTAEESRNGRWLDVVRNLASTRGSNNMFWRAFDVHAEYRHFFYMEPDAWPLRPRWLERVDGLSRDPSFWMRGTVMRYQPRLVVAPEPWRSAYTRHLNGNALYTVRDACFARYRGLVRAAYGDKAFDVAMAMYRAPRYMYALDHAVAHRFGATEVIADMGVEGFASVAELRDKLPGTYIAHAKAHYLKNNNKLAILKY